MRNNLLNIVTVEYLCPDSNSLCGVAGPITYLQQSHCYIFGACVCVRNTLWKRFPCFTHCSVARVWSSKPSSPATSYCPWSHAVEELRQASISGGVNAGSGSSSQVKWDHHQPLKASAVKLNEHIVGRCPRCFKQCFLRKLLNNGISTTNTFGPLIVPKDRFP